MNHILIICIFKVWKTRQNRVLLKWYFLIVIETGAFFLQGSMLKVLKVAHTGCSNGRSYQMNTKLTFT